MGDEADADWQDGLAEAGYDDARMPKLEPFALKGSNRRNKTMIDDHTRIEDVARRLRRVERSRDRISRLYARLDSPPLESDEAKQVAGVVKGILDLLKDMVK